MFIWSRLVVLLSLIVCSVGCDQATKAIANAAIGSGPALSYFGDTVRLTYAENPGGFLSLGANLPPVLRGVLFGIIPAVVVVGLMVPLVRSHSLSRAEGIALALIVSGALGNLIDRLALGAVRDFLNVGIGPVRTGIFNVADVAVTTGVAIFCVLAVTTRSDPEPDPADVTPDSDHAAP
jgi:signal peptidase II